MAGQEKTESATPRRRNEARKRGQVAKSADLSSILVLAGVILALSYLGRVASQTVTAYFLQIFAHLDDTRLDIPMVMRHGGLALMTLIKSVAPLVLIAMTLGISSNIAQTGFVWATEALRPDFNRLNPLTGAQRFVSPRVLVDLAKSILKIGMIGSIAYSTIRNSYPQLMLMTRMDVAMGVSLVTDVVFRMTLRIVMFMLVLSAMDFFFQRYQHEKSIRMTKEEVKQEFKQIEGNMQMKQRIRARQREIAKKRMMAEVPTADVVITNPTHFAVALKYDPAKSSAPLLVAKGQDLMALKIRELAQQNDVPIIENPPLARALYKQVEVGREIPGDLYESVAEVLAFVYQINQRRRERLMTFTS